MTSLQTEQEMSEVIKGVVLAVEVTQDLKLYENVVH